ncbi:hypothetical protein AVEN_249049-1 [Araneus ventricosus]|uniref:Uncharacterized protein n=1 Tax=Araneus ventricosus TaxID=182803 RepID=A0A4Y2W1Y6_ARAVE|nr:hypothetical protein AVEN_249049-1 [Araneus ventricosus]
MTKRGHSDPIEQAARPNKTPRKLNLFLKDICEAEKAKIAIEHGVTQIKVVIDKDKGGCPATTPKKLHTIFDSLLQRDDNYFLTKTSEVVKRGSAQNLHRITSDFSELKEIVDNLKEIVTPLIGLSKIPGFGNDLNNFHSVNQPDTNNLRELNCRLAKEVIDLRAEITRLKFSLESYVKGDPPSRIDVITTSSDPFLGNGSLDVPLEQDFNLFGGETLVSSDFANG